MSVEIEDIKKTINLNSYAKKYYGSEIDKLGKTNCPFHPPDNNPSFQFWKGDNGIYRYTDHHTGEKGTILDFVMKMEKCSLQDALGIICENEGMGLSETGSSSEIIFFLYTDLNGNPTYRKAKSIDSDGKRRFWFEHQNSGNWKKGKGNCELIPYNLNESNLFEKAIVCEGEKDADTVRSVVNDSDLKYWVTSAPNGKGAWPQSITKYFDGQSEIVFIYDVGAERDAEKHAGTLYKAFSKATIFIAEVPLTQENADITDYLDQTPDKSGALKKILTSAKEFSGEHREDQILIECSEDFLRRSFPEIERIVNPFLERNGFTLVGGAKGVGKSLFVIQMALHIASGKPGFLNCTIDKPCNVLLVQQEVSQNGLHDRLTQMVSAGGFDTQRRFFPKTTTESQWHLTNKEHKEDIITMIEQTSADVLILDPLYTFFPGELNQAKDISKIIQPIMELKTRYDLSVVVVHHFSNKSSPDDPKPIQGKFIGHSNLANAADITVGINCLPPNFKDRSLPLPYNHYAKIETTTRHHEWPDDLYIERKDGSLLFTVSSIWNELGKSVPPLEIVDFVKECGGEKLQAEVIAYFERTKGVHENTIRKSIKEAIELGKLHKDKVPGQHNKKMLKIPEQNNPGGEVR